MEELLPFLQKNETWIYLLLGIIAFFPLQKLILAWQQWQGTVYGLEREIAQRRFASALTILVLLVVLVFMEFLLVSFVVPNTSQVSMISTPTLDLLATPTVTLPSLIDAASLSLPTEEVTPTVVDQSMNEGCVKGQIEWINPRAGDEVTETVELKGTVNVPNLGFYRYEFAPAGDDVWTPIAIGNQPKVEGTFSYWNTSSFPSGDYRLRLVVSDNETNLFPACEIAIKIKGQPQ